MRQILDRVGLVVVSSLIVLLLIELTVRIFDVPPRPLDPLPIPSYQLSENPVLLYEFRPGYLPSDEPFNASNRGYRINDAGFRDYDYPAAKPEGTRRILVIGDSTTSGFGIPDLAKTYTKRLEKLLNEANASGQRYEVLSLGVDGYQTMQEVETLRVKGLRYDPDVVLLVFCLNDFFLHVDGGIYEALLETTGRSIVDPGTSFRRFLLRTSRLAFIFYHRLNASVDVQDAWYAEHVLGGRSPVEAGLALLSELRQEHGFEAYVFILPDFSAPFHDYRSTALHQAVFAAAKEPKITVFDLVEPFAATDDNAPVFSLDGCHMNEYGHCVMAEILRPIVRSILGESSISLREGEGLPSAASGCSPEPDGWGGR